MKSLSGNLEGRPTINTLLLFENSVIISRGRKEYEVP